MSIWLFVIFCLVYDCLFTLTTYPAGYIDIDLILKKKKSINSAGFPGILAKTGITWNLCSLLGDVTISL